MTKLPDSAQRVQDFLRENGSAAQVVEMPDSTRTAAEAAEACGCTVGQIAKSLVFRTMNTGRPVLAIVAGDRRASEHKLGALIGGPVERPNAAYVRDATGFAIGGVAPIRYPDEFFVFIDEALFGYDRIWAAAGTPRCVFETTADALQRLTGAKVVDPT